MTTPGTSASVAPPLVVFADDWGRHPSGIQHLVRHLLPGRQVIWVNTIGTRRPRLNRATFWRGWEKLRHWGRIGSPAADRHPNLTVLNPIMWPSFASAASRRLNRWLLLRQLASAIRRLPAPPVAITKTAVVADLLGRLPVRRWVYYCVDDFSQWPGLDQGTLQRMEEELVPKADMVIAASELLRDRLGALGGSPQLLTHGFDPAHWTASDLAIPPVLADLSKPLLVFWGLIDRRLDVAWLAHLAGELTEGTIVLIGPEADPDPALARIPRTVRLPAVPFALLPAVARAAAVLIMPYADLPVSRAMQPLKLKEYMASGKPVVVRDLPATRVWADCLDVVATPEDFARAVRRRLAEGVPAEQLAARKRLDGETWARKAEQFAQWIDAPEISGGS